MHLQVNETARVEAGQMASPDPRYMTAWRLARRAGSLEEVRGWLYCELGCSEVRAAPVSTRSVALVPSGSQATSIAPPRAHSFARQLFDGQGWTNDGAGNRIVREYLVRNRPVASMGPFEWVELPLRIGDVPPSEG